MEWSLRLATTDNIAFYLEIQFWQHFILSQNSVAAVMTMAIVLSS
jgi:hypothetical protein